MVAGGTRPFGHGNLGFLLLGTIASKPAAGYDLIKALENRMGGGHSPRPGLIYPTLTLLEGQGLASVSVEDGMKLCRANAEGEAFLSANRAALDAIKVRIDTFAQQRSADSLSADRSRGGKPQNGAAAALENRSNSLKSRPWRSPQRSMPRRPRPSGSSRGIAPAGAAGVFRAVGACAGRWGSAPRSAGARSQPMRFSTIAGIATERRDSPVGAGSG